MGQSDAIKTGPVHVILVSGTTIVFLPCLQPIRTLYYVNFEFFQKSLGVIQKSLGVIHTCPNMLPPVLSRVRLSNCLPFSACLHAVCTGLPCLLAHQVADEKLRMQSHELACFVSCGLNASPQVVLLHELTCFTCIARAMPSHALSCFMDYKRNAFLHALACFMYCTRNALARVGL